MKYIVITSKHHDGFALFDSKFSDFDVMATPFKRDILKELGRGLPEARPPALCFYHSIMDWHHPDYLPRRDWEKDRPADGRGFRPLCPIHEKPAQGAADQLRADRRPLVRRRMGEHLERSLRHATSTNMSGASSRTSSSITGSGRAARGWKASPRTRNRRAISERPSSRSRRPGFPALDWETCMTMNDNWGYNSHDQNWKSARDPDPDAGRHRLQRRQFPAERRPDGRRCFPAAQRRPASRHRGMDEDRTANRSTAPRPARSKASTGGGARRSRGRRHAALPPCFRLAGGRQARRPRTSRAAQQRLLLSDPTEKALPAKREDDALVISVPASGSRP